MMIQFGKLGIELKSGILFSVSSLVFSMIAGFAGGVPAGMVLLRVMVIAPVFFVVGYGIILVIEKFVPEVYEAFSKFNVSSEKPAGKIDISIDTSEDGSEESSENADSGFTEFTEKDYDRLQTVRDSDDLQPVKDLDKMQTVRDSEKSQTVSDTGLDNLLHASNTKLGKHIIVENDLSSYEPKLMAQAVRTMMGKDKD